MCQHQMEIRMAGRVDGHFKQWRENIANEGAKRFELLVENSVQTRNLDRPAYSLVRCADRILLTEVVAYVKSWYQSAFDTDLTCRQYNTIR